MSQSDDQTLDQQDESQDNSQPTEEQDEFDFTVDEDRLSLYERLDKANKEIRSAAEAEGFLNAVEEDADEDETEDEEQADAVPRETDEPQERTETPEPGPKLEGKVLSREEFEELFKDIKIKTKIAGEEVEAPVREFIKATGLEKHYTKRLQELSRREREILQNRKDSGGVEEQGPSEDEIAQKYDELFEDSPYKAKKYLEEVEKQKDSFKAGLGQARIQRAVDDFKSIYPECTDEEWGKMNDPSFWQAHEDIVKLKDQGDVFATLVTAYTRLQQSNVRKQAVEETKKAKAPQTVKDKTQRKKEGQVIRTAVKTTKAPAKKKGFELEPAGDYIAALRKQARQRMGIDD